MNKYIQTSLTLLLLAATPIEAYRGTCECGFFVRPIYLEGVVVRGPMRCYTIKENNIGLAVSDIPLYRQTDNLLLLYILINLIKKIEK